MDCFINKKDISNTVYAETHTYRLCVHTCSAWLRVAIPYIGRIHVHVHVHVSCSYACIMIMNMLVYMYIHVHLYIYVNNQTLNLHVHVLHLICPLEHNVCE